MSRRRSARLAFSCLLLLIFAPAFALAQQEKQQPPVRQTPAKTAAKTPPQSPVAPTVSLPPLAIQSHSLPNGLRVVTLEDHSVPIINLQVWYHVGSKDERPGRTGFAHLFEHLMFKGSAHIGADQHNRMIERMGGVVNAYTNDDVTVYWETFPSRYLARVLWMEADRMGSLDVTQANFATEREVVKEERRLRIENPPYGRVTEDLYAAAFTVHPYHHITIGSMDDLNKATLDDVRDFYRTFYRPNNATLVVVGDFSTPALLASAEKYFGGIPASPAPIPRVTVKEPPQTAERRLTRSYPNSPLPAVIEGFKAPPRFSPGQYPLELGSNILSQGQSSRLYRSLVYTKRIALQAFGQGNFTEDPNLFFIGAVLNPGVSVADGEKAVDQVVDSMRSAPVDPPELEKARNQIISRMIRSRETDQGKADAIGEAAVIGGNPLLVNQELARYLRVSAADIERASREYFSSRRATILLIEPPKAPAAAPGGH
jgi:zinc protease